MTTIMTRSEFERALDTGRLETAIVSRNEKRWYRCRRNGQTKTWKRDATRFEIPIKFRFKDTMRVSNKHWAVIEVWFRIVD